jgi:hypothetical protein
MRKASKVKSPYNDHRSQWVTLGEYKEAKKTGGSIYASKHGSNLVSVEGQESENTRLGHWKDPGITSTEQVCCLFRRCRGENH